jgi:hypothetical protein
MHTLVARRSCPALALAASAALFVLGCGAPEPHESTSHGESEDAESSSGVSASNTSQPATSAETVDTADTEAPVGWFQVGWGQGEFVPLADGDPFPIVLGGQGAQMFPMPLQGGEWFLPENPTSWMDETGPLVDMDMDIEGWNDGPGGHFKHIANYTLDWIILPDGTYQSSFLPILVPDGITPEDLDGLPAHIWVRLRPYEQPALELELDVVVTVSDDPLPG